MSTSIRNSIAKSSLRKFRLASAHTIQSRLVPVVLGILTAVISTYLMVANESLYIIRIFSR